MKCHEIPCILINAMKNHHQIPWNAIKSSLVRWATHCQSCLALPRPWSKLEEMLGVPCGSARWVDHRGLCRGPASITPWTSWPSGNRCFTHKEVVIFSNDLVIYSCFRGRRPEGVARLPRFLIFFFFVLRGLGAVGCGGWGGWGGWGGGDNNVTWLPICFSFLSHDSSSFPLTMNTSSNQHVQDKAFLWILLRS